MTIPLARDPPAAGRATCEGGRAAVRSLLTLERGHGDRETERVEQSSLYFGDRTKGLRVRSVREINKLMRICKFGA